MSLKGSTVRPHSLNDSFKVAAASLKLEIRLHAHPVCTNTWSGTEAILPSSDWLMRSDLCYFTRNLVSGINEGAATLRKEIFKFSYTVRPRKKQNPKTMECCEHVLACMTIIIYISWGMINMLSNDTLFKFLQSCFTEQHCFKNWMSKSICAILQ